MPSEAGSGRRRVPALAPEERRAVLVAATIPLLREHGPGVTTRQIAEAAGVAEGTIFGVFPDKASLLAAAVIATIGGYDGPGATAPPLPFAGIDRGLDLRDRLLTAVRQLADGSRDRQTVMMAMRALPQEHREAVFERLKVVRQRAMAGLADLIEPDRARLRQSPQTAARLLMVLIMGAHRGEMAEEPLSPEEIVELLMHGLLKEGA